jgi:hypothetical protein
VITNQDCLRSLRLRYRAVRNLGSPIPTDYQAKALVWLINYRLRKLTLFIISGCTYRHSYPLNLSFHLQAMSESDTPTRKPSKEEEATHTTVKHATEPPVGQPKHALKRYSYSCSYSTLFVMPCVLCCFCSLVTGNRSFASLIHEDHDNVNSSTNCDRVDLSTCVSTLCKGFHQLLTLDLQVLGVSVERA